MNKQIFTVPAQLMGITSKMDGGMSLRFHTQEITPDEKAAIMKWHGDAGWLAFGADNQITRNLPKEDTGMDTKSPSQRLRAVLFVLWKQSEDNGDFEQYYKEKMEAFINAVKGKLDE